MNNSKYIYQGKAILSIVMLLMSFIIHAQRPEYHIIIDNHLFYPEKIVLPANTKVKLIITNRDQTVEEFDSFSLNREKVIFPNQQAVIFVGPLSVGEYDFFGEYHPHSARGKVIVVQQALINTTENGDENVN